MVEEEALVVEVSSNIDPEMIEKVVNLTTLSLLDDLQALVVGAVSEVVEVDSVLLPLAINSNFKVLNNLCNHSNSSNSMDNHLLNSIDHLRRWEWLECLLQGMVVRTSISHLLGTILMFLRRTLEVKVGLRRLWV